MDGAVTVVCSVAAFDNRPAKPARKGSIDSGASVKGSIDGTTDSTDGPPRQKSSMSRSLRRLSHGALGSLSFETAAPPLPVCAGIWGANVLRNASAQHAIAFYANVADFLVCSDLSCLMRFPGQLASSWDVCSSSKQCKPETGGRCFVRWHSSVACNTLCARL